MNPLLLRALLASLPILGFVLDSRSGFLYGVAGFGILLVSTIIFLGLHRLIPKNVQQLFFFMILLASGMAGRRFLFGSQDGAASFLLVSFCVLALPDLFRNSKKARPILRKTIWVGFFFWIFLTVQGALSEIFAKRLGILFFQLPSGNYLFAGLALACFSQKRKKK